MAISKKGVYYQSSSFNFTKTTKIKPSQIKIGDYIICNNHPCKVKKIRMAKTGKHGRKKYIVTFHGSDGKMKKKQVEKSCVYPLKSQVEKAEIKKYHVICCDAANNVGVVGDGGEEIKDVVKVDDDGRMKIYDILDEDKECCIHLFFVLGKVILATEISSKEELEAA